MARLQDAERRCERAAGLANDLGRDLHLDQDVLRQADGRRPLPELLASAYQPDAMMAELRRRGIEPLA